MSNVECRMVESLRSFVLYRPNILIDANSPLEEESTFIGFFSLIRLDTRGQRLG
ncbi:hypothetical protein D1AOALGA4SA_9072 [Olavius algarvensis Delta 1 endosymbiont]|nr:hypothetical protein D1AOALGA4SA_9072 [Olavius algarvensis Delta 1 endosymbiont]